jgi:hypothetical protein
MEEPPPIHRTDGNTGHIGIAQDIIDIIEGENAPEELLEQEKPLRMFSILFPRWPFDEECHVLWIDGFPFLQGAVGAPPDPLQDGRNFFPDDVLADFLMVRLESRKILLVEKMAEGSMADIMEEASESEEFFDIEGRRKVFPKDAEQRGIKPVRKDTRDMHRPKGMLKTGMFCRGKNPTGTLKLKDAPESLNPGRVNDIPFGPLPFHAVSHHNVMVNGICNQPGELTLFCPHHPLRPVLGFIG